MYIFIIDAVWWFDGYILGAHVYTHHLMDIWRIYSVASSTDGPGQKIYKREINLFLGKKKKLYNTHIISSTWLCCGIGCFVLFFFRAETSDTSRSTTPNTPTSFIKRRFSLRWVNEYSTFPSFPPSAAFWLYSYYIFSHFVIHFLPFYVQHMRHYYYTFDSALYIIISSQRNKKVFFFDAKVAIDTFNVIKVDFLI